MTPLRLTCVGCQAEFPPNGELASIPNANKIAFDWPHHRVWRICDECSEWNLLGAEAAAAALPELEARFAAAPSEQHEGLGLARAGERLELIRIDDEATVTQNERAAAERRKQIDRETVVLSAGGLVMWGWLAWVILTRHNGPMIGAASGLLFTVSWMLLVRAFWAWRYRKPLPQYKVVAIVAAFILSSAVQVAYARVAWSAVQMLDFALVLAVLAVLGGRPRRALRMRIADGRWLTLNEFEAMHVTLSWNPGGDSLAVHDILSGHELSGDDATKALQLLLRFSIRGSKPAVTEQAHQLLRTTGGLSGLLASLDGLKDDRGGRLVVEELPAVYRVALDMALAKSAPALGATEEIRLRAGAAGFIAAEAEALDPPG